MGVRLFAAVLTVLLHAIVAMALLNPHWFERPASAIPALQALEPAERTLPRHDARASRPPLSISAGMLQPHRAVAAPTLHSLPRHSGDSEAQAAFEAGWHYEANRFAAIHALNAEIYSAEVAEILRKPLGESWPQLEALTQSGNRSAGDALHDMAFQCHPGPGLTAGAFSRLSDSLQAGIPDADGAFVAGALAHELADFEDVQRQCATHGLGMGRLAAMLGLPHPSTSPQGSELDYLVALGEEFRARFGRGDGAIPAQSTPGAVALALLADGQSAAAGDDLAIAIEAAADEPFVTARLAHCFHLGCGQIPALPPEELRPWQERAAGSGSAGAAHALIAADESAGELERAFAWAWFSRWIAANACDALPRVLDYAAAAQHLARIGARLHPAARMRAEREGAALIARLGPAALAATGCAD